MIECEGWLGDCFVSSSYILTDDERRGNLLRIRHSIYYRYVANMSTKILVVTKGIELMGIVQICRVSVGLLQLHTHTLCCK